MKKNKRIIDHKLVTFKFYNNFEKGTFVKYLVQEFITLSSCLELTCAIPIRRYDVYKKKNALIVFMSRER